MNPRANLKKPGVFNDNFIEVVAKLYCQSHSIQKKYSFLKFLNHMKENDIAKGVYRGKLG